MLADAVGSSSNDWNRSRHLVPSCWSSILCTCLVGSGGAAAWSLFSDSRYGSANSSGIAASMTLSAWPSFIAPPLSSPSTANSCSAAFALNCASISPLSPPASLRPKPMAARPAIPRGMLASLAVRAELLRGISDTTPSCLTGASFARNRCQVLATAGYLPRPAPGCDPIRTERDLERRRQTRRMRRRCLR